MARPRLPRRRLLRARRAPRRRALAGPDDGPHHLPLRGVDAREVRPRLQHADAPRAASASTSRSRATSSYQGESFLNRFDANSYLYLTRVMDYFDPFGDVAAAIARLRGSRTRFLVLSFDTDWRFATEHSREIVRVLSARARAGHVPRDRLAARPRLVPAARARVPPHRRGVRRAHAARGLRMRPDLEVVAGDGAGRLARARPRLRRRRPARAPDRRARLRRLRHRDRRRRRARVHRRRRAGERGRHRGRPCASSPTARSTSSCCRGRCRPPAGPPRSWPG